MGTAEAKSQRCKIFMIVAGLMVTSVFSVYAQDDYTAFKENSEVQARIEKRLERMKTATSTLSITVFPVLMVDRPFVKVSRVMALLLEKTGLKNIKVSENEFIPTDPGDVLKIAEEFSGFIRDNPVATDYALYAGFYGTPGKGLEKLITIVVSKSGDYVWVECQTSEDEIIRQLDHPDPMGFCYASVEKLRRGLNLSDPNSEDAYEGEWARLFEQESLGYGAPDKEEFQQIEAREKEFYKEARVKRLVIYAVNIIGKTSRCDTEGTILLVEKLKDTGFEQVEMLDSPAELPFQPKPNEAEIFWERARAFSSQVKANPPEADYVLILDVFGELNQGRVHAVHAVATDGMGQIAYGRLWNSHQPLFKEIQPKSLEDACRMVVEDLRRKMRDSQ